MGDGLAVVSLLVTLTGLLVAVAFGVWKARGSIEASITESARSTREANDRAHEKMREANDRAHEKMREANDRAYGKMREAQERTEERIGARMDALRDELRADMRADRTVFAEQVNRLVAAVLKRPTD